MHGTASIWNLLAHWILTFLRNGGNFMSMWHIELHCITCIVWQWHHQCWYEYNGKFTQQHCIHILHVINWLYMLYVWIHILRSKEDTSQAIDALSFTTHTDGGRAREMGEIYKPLRTHCTMQNAKCTYKPI